MTKFQCKMDCVVCNNSIDEWYIRDVPKNWRFFSKCPSCNVTNLFFAPKHLTLKQVVTFVSVNKIKPILREIEAERLERVKIKYKVPKHIPTAQIERYKKKKKDNHFERIDEIWKS